MSHSSQWFANRFIDDTVSNDDQLGPIHGYQNQPIVSLEKALEPVRSFIENLVDYIKMAEECCHYPNEHGLTKDQSASVYLYTMEWGNDSFYRVLNTALRAQDRSALKPWFSFLKLFDTALKKLLHLQRNVWRGIRSVLGKDCKKGDELIWWSINSCSLDVHIIEHFLTANSTLFLIEAINARDITGYTNYPNEHEVILSPGIRLQVVANSMQHTGGLHIVHLRETKLSGHFKCLLPVPLEKNSFSKHETTQIRALHTRLAAWFRRTCLSKPYIMATVILILVGMVVGVTVGMVTKNKNSVSIIPPQDNLTIVHSPATMPNSSNTILDSTSTRLNNAAQCLDINPPTGFVVCHKWAEVFSCRSIDCDQVSAVHSCATYPSDCYAIGQVITDGGNSNIWYRLILPSSGFGHVNGVYCFGNPDRCS